MDGGKAQLTVFHLKSIVMVDSVQNQEWNSEFGSNKVRKRLLARILKILEEARKRLTQQNSTKKCVNSPKKFVNSPKNVHKC